MNFLKKFFQFIILIFISIISIGNNLEDPRVKNHTDFLFNTFNDVRIFDIKNDPWVEQTLNSMTIEEKAGQLLFPYASGKYYSEDNPSYLRLKHLVEEMKIGGIIFFQSGIYEEAILTNKLQSLSKIPLLISSDFERGVAQHVDRTTSFPYSMALGAANDTALVYRMGKIIAREGLSFGVHQNYAPVADVNNEANNPIINVRAFGEKVELVANLSNAFLKGLQDGGMVATSKHFPGHGNTTIDSHKDLPVISGSEDELMKTELAPFISNINNGVMSIMIGHLGVPVFDSDTISATLSPKIVTKLLREKLKFNGLIVTDAMNMHAITKRYTTGEAAILALEAGNDLILFPDPSFEDEVVHSVVRAVYSGRISVARIDESVRRILILKRWLKLHEKSQIDIDSIADNIGIDEHFKVANLLAEKSITLVKNEKNLLPVSSGDKKKYHHIILLDTKESSPANRFQNLIAARNPSVTTTILTPRSTKGEYREAMNEIKKKDIILLSTYLKVRAYQGTIGLNAKQETFVAQLLKTKKPVLLLSHGNPYLLSNFPKVNGYITNYGEAEISETALAASLFGETHITGKLPISLPNTNFIFGDGIELKKSALSDKSKSYSLQEKEKFSNVDSLINNSIKDSAFPGAVILIAKEGEILHKKAFGNMTYDFNSRTMTTETIFDLASVSKVIATTTAAMICVDRKLFKLEDKVVKYIPAFGKNGKKNITLKDLLLHQSGLPAFKPYYKLVKNGNELLQDIYNSKLDFETGTKMVYSDLGMITLAKVIEKVSKKSLDKFCYENIFSPLGMRNTFYNPAKEIREKIAPTEVDNYFRNRLLIGEVHDETAYMLNGVAGHAGLFSTVSDIAVLLQMLLQKGNYQGVQLIKPETVALFTSRQSKISSRGIGWDTKSEKSSAGELFSSTSFGHTGYTGTSVWVDPEKKVFAILFTNRVHPTRNNIKIGKVRPQFYNEVIRAMEN